MPLWSGETLLREPAPTRTQTLLWLRAVRVLLQAALEVRKPLNSSFKRTFDRITNRYLGAQRLIIPPARSSRMI